MADETQSVADVARAAFEEVENGTQAERVERPERTEQPQETAAERTERQRDESGRFARGEKPRETLVLREKPAPAAEGQTDPTKAAPSVANDQTKAGDQPKPGEDRIAPPAEWKGLGKVKWNLLPKEVQTELRGTYEALNAERAEVAPLKEMIDLNRATLVREAGSVHEGVRQLLQFHELSLTKPLDLIQHIAQQRGIDLRAYFGGQAGQQPATQPGQPDISKLIAQTVQQHLQPYQAQIEQRESQQLETTIATFAADPKHPFFNDVRSHMGQLLKAGAAKDMNEAYEQATWANPAIRAHLLQEQTEKAAADRVADADRARRATGASLRGSPLPDGVSGGGKTSPTSVHDAVRAAYAEANGA